MRTMGDVVSDLAEFGINVFDSDDKFRSFQSVAMDLSKIWDSLTEKEKSHFSIVMLGYDSKLFKDILNEQYKRGEINNV